MWVWVAAAATMAIAQSALAQEPGEKPVLSEPSLSADGQLVAFVSGGDIWEAPASGGVAHLVVTGPATEGRPLYSPDGRKLAFTSTRGGSANIYVLDLPSGELTRLTYGEGGEELDGWSADGRWIYFAAGDTDVGKLPDIYRVSSEGGTPLPVSAERYLSEYQASPSPDGSSIAFMTRGISFSQWWRNGSSHIDQSEMWVKPTVGEGGYQRILSDPSRHAWPMWEPSGGAIWYMSDAGGAENLWRLETSGGAPQKITAFTDGRLLYPSMARGGSALVFERDFGIWRLDPKSGQAAQIPLSLRGAPAGEQIRHATVDKFTRLSVSPDGEKVAVIGYGELFAGAAKDGGSARRITNSLGAEREAVWSPDSRHLLYVTERGLNHLLAEYDFATGRETMLTSTGHASVPVFAPDGKSAMYVLDDQQLRKLTFARPGVGQSDVLLYRGPITADANYGPRPVWSPDGSYIAFPLTDHRSFTNVAVVPAAGGEARPVSFLANGQMSGIAWSPDGKYILFDSGQRSEDSRIVRVDLTPHVPKLKEDQFADLFTDKQPGETKESAKTDKPDKAKKEALPPPPANPAKIVWDGLRERTTVLPLGLNAAAPVISPDGKTLLFIASERGQDNLYSYNLDELADEPPVPKQISASAKPKRDIALPADGKTVFYLDGQQVISTPIDTPKPKVVAVAGDMDVDFSKEKRVVFDEAWDVLNRRFYDPNFHGKDWGALREHYLPYAMGSQTPDELRRVTNLMIGELDASHSGHNRPARGEGSLPSDRVGDLGLRFDRAAYEAGRGLVVNEVVDLGPAAIGGVHVGDVLASVDGRAIGPRTNLDSLLENKVGKRVVLGLGGGRQVVVQPVSWSTATGLLYRQWVNERRALVDRVSGGRLGYVHLADMSSDSLNQLYLDLDAENQSKQGVVVDVRNNNGGFINGYALDVFARKNFLTMTQRGYLPVPSRQALGQRALGKPTVLVTNESSLSDAEDFSEGYRTLGLGKIVGQPTAGWIIYTGPETLIDGSTVRVPQVRIQGANGEDMEGHPRPVDIAIERPLGEGAAGHDAQLEAAVATLLQQIGAGR
jgi:Tol biopolymer transport system component/C-terminal processing protease CtpA/Prc